MTKQTKKGKLARRGALSMIVLLLLSSAAIRGGLGVTEVMARSSDEPISLEPKPMAEPKTDSAALTPLLASLKEREERLIVREREMELRAKTLEVASREVEARIEALKQAEEDLRATLSLADTAAEDDLVRLTSLYENMKPKDAAALFEEMDPGFAAGFLGRMRADAAASVMAGLSPQTAYSISVIMAGRNANAPKN